MPPIHVIKVSEEPVPPFTGRRAVYSSETVNIPTRLHGVIAHKTPNSRCIRNNTCVVRYSRVYRVAVVRAATKSYEAVICFCRIASVLLCHIRLLDERDPRSSTTEILFAFDNRAS